MDCCGYRVCLYITLCMLRSDLFSLVLPQFSHWLQNSENWDSLSLQYIYFSRDIITTSLYIINLL